jgi:hypothetical protein
MTTQRVMLRGGMRCERSYYCDDTGSIILCSI